MRVVNLKQCQQNEQKHSLQMAKRLGDAAIFRLVSFYCDFIFIVTFLHFFLLFRYARSVTECDCCVCVKN